MEVVIDALVTAGGLRDFYSSNGYDYITILGYLVEALEDGQDKLIHEI